MGRELEELEEVPAGNVLGKYFLSHSYTDRQNSWYSSIKERNNLILTKAVISKNLLKIN